MNSPTTGSVPDDSVSLAPGDDLHKRPENTHLVLYLVLFAAFVGLSVWGLVAFNHDKQSDEANALATELALKFSAAGIEPIDIDSAARVLGTDGGAACADPVAALNEAALDQQIVSGATGPGMRPVIAARNRLVGSRLMLEVYCPENLAEFDAAVADLKLGDG
ncbi:conserved hypothetical protein [Rhodococcus sp. RD6.2]|jgi:hypothetical protein|uniref:hypothetical protein n=1 Tax=Rhodococcus sp. RD6.2 TaxID=260936 RepID=UPI00063B72F7|nr:hypothetical protein [Rhodococcus sp. RD6.2]CRK49188.1 conserved hypothetical protein [Rhodococcus sp. RD6.2]